MTAGRPSDYTPEKCDEICAEIISGKSLRSICARDDMPAVITVMSWLRKHPEFAAQYARAREEQAETYADEIVAIADDGRNDTYIDENGNERVNQDVVARSRLRVEARKWVASKLKPKKYGEKIQTEVSGSMEIRSATELSDDQLASIAMQQVEK